jgi:hypothetical protein
MCVPSDDECSAGHCNGVVRMRDKISAAEFRKPTSVAGGPTIIPPQRRVMTRDRDDDAGGAQSGCGVTQPVAPRSTEVARRVCSIHRPELVDVSTTGSAIQSCWLSGYSACGW